MDPYKDRDWMIDAQCRGLPPEEFTPELPPNANVEAATRVAAKVCATCPVIAECAQYALATGNLHGLWAGVPFGGSSSDKARYARLRNIAYPKIETLRSA